MYLLDTNIISERTKREPDDNVRRWLRAHHVGETYLSVLTLAELEQGILRLGETNRAQQLGLFLSTLERQFSGRILPINRQVAHHWAIITANASLQGKTLSYADSLIAATAQAHDLTVVTRNTTDFDASGVTLVNPWKPLAT